MTLTNIILTISVTLLLGLILGAYVWAEKRERPGAPWSGALGRVAVRGLKSLAVWVVGVAVGLALLSVVFATVGPAVRAWWQDWQETRARKANYECLRDTRELAAGAGTFIVDGVRVNYGLYVACMRAKGFPVG